MINLPPPDLEAVMRELPAARPDVTRLTARVEPGPAVHFVATVDGRLRGLTLTRGCVSWSTPGLLAAAIERLPPMKGTAP